MANELEECKNQLAQAKKQQQSLLLSQ